MEEDIIHDFIAHHQIECRATHFSALTHAYADHEQIVCPVCDEESEEVRAQNAGLDYAVERYYAVVERNGKMALGPKMNLIPEEEPEHQSWVEWWLNPFD